MIQQTWKMSIHLHKQFFFNPRFSPAVHKLRQNENCDITANNSKNTIHICITTLIPLWYPEVNPFAPFCPTFHNKFFINQHNFTKNRAKIMTESKFSTKSVCSKPRIYPSSKILHKQRWWRSWHFPCLWYSYDCKAVDIWILFFSSGLSPLTINGWVLQIFL